MFNPASFEAFLATFPWFAIASHLVALAAIVTLLVTVPLALRALPIARHDLAIGAGLFVAALLLRWFLPEHALIHENRHGYDLTYPGVSHGVFSSHMLLMAIVALFTGTADAPAILGVFCSSVAVVATYALGHAWTGRRFVAFSGAAAVATLPLALLMAPTEEFLVSATALVLAGAAFIHVGIASNVRISLVTGCLLLVLGAQAREVTLPLSLFAPIAAFTAAPEGWKRRDAWLAMAGIAVALSPQLWNVLAAAMTLHGRPEYIGGLPVMPWDHEWAGWDAPSVPRWMGVAMCVGAVVLPVVLIRSRRHRGAIAIVASLVVAELAGGLVSSGNWPSQLRHQLLAQTLFAFAAGATLALPFGDRLVAALPMPLAGALTLVLSPAGYRPHTPHIAEYLFARDAFEHLPPRATLIDLGEPVLGEHFRLHFISARWAARLRDDLRVLPLAKFLDNPRRSEVWALFDRACFRETESYGIAIDGGRGAPDEKTMVPVFDTPLGRMNEACRRLYDVGPWEVVRSIELTSPGAMHDLPTAEKTVRVVLARRRGN